MVSDLPSVDSVRMPSDADSYSPEIAYSVTPFTTVVVCGSTWMRTTWPVMVTPSSVIGAAWSRPTTLVP